MTEYNIQFAVSGDRRDAIYRQPEIPEYFDNPMIEALPPIWDEDEATEEISYFPEYSEKRRKLPKHIRHHLIQNSFRFFSPLDIHIDLERRFSCLLRVGYRGRNPSEGEFWKAVDKRVKSIRKTTRNQYKRTRKYHSTAASGFYIVGISGIGKSQAVEQILMTYPQVILHSKYKRKNFTYTQLVWFKLDCPFDASLRGLCYNFFQNIDDILGTNYFFEYAEKARNVDEMIPSMARVAANHCIGVLVIDEIQRLSTAKSGGAEVMLNFFVQIVNNIGIPVVLVGTYKALPILSGSVSQMRRGTGQGDIVWDRMQFDEQWNLLIESLWDYQYTERKCDLNPRLSEVLYEETQGITDLAIKLFMFAQERAITSGEERITTSVIRSAARDKFNLLQPALRAFKEKDKTALSDFEDAYPKFLKVILLEAQPSPQILGSIIEEPEIKILLDSNVENEVETGTKEDPAISESQQAINDFFGIGKAKSTNGKTSNRKVSEGLLPSIFDSLENPDKTSVYSSLKKAGFIFSGSEFM